VRDVWGRLLQIEANGGTGDVRNLSAPRITLGREEGDVICPDDEFMSRRHAQLNYKDGLCTIKDLGSSNGTFVQLREPTVLATGDHLRVGDQMFRFEIL
jgi:pSer/pThr/pTyr-binding forkhead associated (FHA) protein